MRVELGYIETIDGRHNSVRSGVRLSPDQAELYCCACRTLFDFSEALAVFDYLKSNLDDLHVNVERNVEHVRTHKASVVSNPTLLSEQVAGLNNRIANILSSIHACSDITPAVLRRAFGRDSREFREFLKLKDVLLQTDENFALMCDLRNNSQHRMLPIVTVEMLRLSKSQNSTVEPVYRILLDTKGLLSSGYGERKNPEVRRRMERLPDKADFAPLLQKGIQAPLKMLSYALECFRGPFLDAGKILASATLLSNAPPASTPVVWDGTRVTENDIDGCSVIPIAQLLFCWRQFSDLPPLIAFEEQPTEALENKVDCAKGLRRPLRRPTWAAYFGSFFYG